MVTQKQIAQRLNLSQSTVANILRGAAVPKYSEETRRVVLTTAEELGYRPNRSAQIIQRGRSNLVGIIHFGAKLEVSGKVATHLPQLVNAHGYDYMVVDLRWHGGNVERVLNEMIQARVEGVIVTHSLEAFGPQYTALLAGAAIPVVSLYGNERLNVPVVSDDSRSAFFAMTKHLQAIGHRNLLLILGGSRVRPMEDRLNGFQLGMRGKGPCRSYDEDEFFAAWKRMRSEGRKRSAGTVLRIDNHRYGNDVLAAHYEVTRRLLAQGHLPDAILCSNDTGAFGVFNAAYGLGVSIPGELAVTGCDDDQFGGLPMFELTTVRKDIPGASAAAVEMLVGKIEGKRDGTPCSLFQSSLVLRASCGRPGGKGAPEEVVSLKSLPFPARSVFS